ncbi:hypothetical protein MNEG_5111 [Monoraphidium neglectum]|jgi:YidC/Oxa1 family membrane protein insertase|uniref:Uncharacterized protein n=1 Tax=Monoraphidium neglectum TaxID=145388 RepID=A0A0D2NBI1_9CHLO|nr:hypothetical protein MNEG_5111 [Monoraphidium neglectum]KIZ02846.1 hypothetical protein MNEG_5111 [Monoraphidium neglectum]|eukprot:XP_013901865.1 hypothetical protein MNEG_5111 [Monoraphidium neglectum]
MASKFGNDAKWALLMPVIALVNMTVFISQFSAVSTLANESLPSMAREGLAWFPDLTVPDPLWGLPVLCTAMTLALVESGAMGAEMGQAQTAKTVKWVMRVVAVSFVPFGGFVPAAVGLLWSSNSVFSLAQAAVLRHKGLRERLGLPSLAAMAAASQAAKAGAPTSELAAKFKQLVGAAPAQAATAAAAAGNDAAGATAAAAAAAGAAGGRGAAAAVPPPPGTRPSRIVMQKPRGWKPRKS